MSTRIAWPVSILMLLVVSPALASPWMLAPKEWFSELESGVASSPNTYLESGESANAGLVVERRQISLLNEYGWKKSINLFATLPLLSVTRQNDLTGVQGTATGFQDLQIGIRFPFPFLKKYLPATLEYSWTGPLGYNRYLDTLGLNLGDGLQQLKLEGHFGYALWNRGFAQASFGRALRFLGTKSLVAARNNTKPENPSQLTGKGSEEFHYQDQLHATADVAVWVGSSILVSGGYRGFNTIANGPLEDNVDLNLFGPQVLYRLDEKVDLYAGTWTSASGRNVQSFTQVYAGLAFRRTKLSRLQGFMGGKQAP